MWNNIIQMEPAEIVGVVAILALAAFFLGYHLYAGVQAWRDTRYKFGTRQEREAENRAKGIGR